MCPRESLPEKLGINLVFDMMTQGAITWPLGEHFREQTWSITPLNVHEG